MFLFFEASRECFRPSRLGKFVFFLILFRFLGIFCNALLCPALFCPTLFCPALFCPYAILSCDILSLCYFVLRCFVRYFVLHHFVLRCFLVESDFSFCNVTFSSLRTGRDHFIVYEPWCELLYLGLSQYWDLTKWPF